ncbi:MAG: NAD-dependent succinate-semialdehyde dehydrogenase, partial [bacterium]|nr:NAD-dependent succinate-semialdehyde dehydrogenase [Candidatus Kapabacteria bacterium]
MHSINPASGETFAEYADDLADEIELRLARANQAFAKWRSTSFSVRAECMRRAASLLRERAGRYSEIMTREMGKPIAAAEAEVEKCAWVCEYYAENAERFLADEEIATDASRSWIAYEPLGPVLAIMPWNFPFWQVIRFAAPALMAGNVGLLKHASNVPGSALAIEEVFADAGVMDGGFQTLLVSSRAIEGIIADDRIRAVTLTGSEGAGRSVGAASGRAIKKVVLELGGSDPFVVMPSADLDRAVATAVTARTINNGQSCIAAKRFIVHRDISEEFEKRFASRMSQLKVGDPIERDVDVGPLARPEFVDELHDQVQRSISAGARVVVGGDRIDRAGYFYVPTVLADVRPGMAAFDEETFGPVATLTIAENIDDAIALANTSRFGLGASAWSTDTNECDRFAREIEAGSVFINGMV